MRRLFARVGASWALVAVLAVVGMHSATLLGSGSYHNNSFCSGAGCGAGDCEGGCFCWATNQYCESEDLCDGSYCNESEGQCGSTCTCNVSATTCFENVIIED